MSSYLSCISSDNLRSLIESEDNLEFKKELFYYETKNNFDYTISTEDNYSSDEIIFVGKYGKHRQNLDYSYHKHYKIERQLFHDVLIDQFLNTIVRDSKTGAVCEKPLQNWIVFTAGPMGSGKSRSLNYLSSKGYFPLESFVRVDPDILRHMLPEAELYIKCDPTNAGRLTQKEVSYISEVLTMDALEKSKNVLVDGSLRDAVWYSQYFRSLRHRFPNLKIAILQFICDDNTVLDRARRRGLITGRVIPDAVIKNTIAQLPKSMTLLAPLADLVAVFQNEDNKPLELVHFSQKEDGKECSPQKSNYFYDSDWSEDHSKSEHVEPKHTLEDFSDVWQMACAMPSPNISRQPSPSINGDLNDVHGTNATKINETKNSVLTFTNEKSENNGLKHL